MGVKQEFESYRTHVRSLKDMLRYKTGILPDPLRITGIFQVVGPTALEMGAPLVYLGQRLLFRQSPESIRTDAERIIKFVSDRRENR